MYKAITVAALVAAFVFAAFPVYADDVKGMGQKVDSQIHQGRGMVNKVDLKAGKINISHQAIKSLQWPQMTMDFNVQDKSALEGIKPGMQVNFELAKFGSGYRITRIVQRRE